MIQECANNSDGHQRRQPGGSAKLFQRRPGLFGEDQPGNKPCQGNDREGADAYFKELINDLLVFIRRNENLFEEAQDEPINIINAVEKGFHYR